jgi:hypothetical protein
MPDNLLPSGDGIIGQLMADILSGLNLTTLHEIKRISYFMTLSVDTLLSPNEMMIGE